MKSLPIAWIALVRRSLIIHNGCFFSKLGIIFGLKVNFYLIGPLTCFNCFLCRLLMPGCSCKERAIVKSLLVKGTVCRAQSRHCMGKAVVLALCQPAESSFTKAGVQFTPGKMLRISYRRTLNLNTCSTRFWSFHCLRLCKTPLLPFLNPSQFKPPPHPLWVHDSLSVSVLKPWLQLCQSWRET